MYVYLEIRIGSHKIWKFAPSLANVLLAEIKFGGLPERVLITLKFGVA